MTAPIRNSHSLPASLFGSASSRSTESNPICTLATGAIRLCFDIRAFNRSTSSCSSVNFTFSNDGRGDNSSRSRSCCVSARICTPCDTRRQLQTAGSAHATRSCTHAAKRAQTHQLDPLWLEPGVCQQLRRRVLAAIYVGSGLWQGPTFSCQVIELAVLDGLANTVILQSKGATARDYASVRTSTAARV